MPAVVIGGVDDKPLFPHAYRYLSLEILK